MEKNIQPKTRRIIVVVTTEERDALRRQKINLGYAKNCIDKVYKDCTGSHTALPAELDDAYRFLLESIDLMEG